MYIYKKYIYLVNDIYYIFEKNRVKNHDKKFGKKIPDRFLWTNDHINICHLYLSRKKTNTNMQILHFR